jgi:hypothetical protein
MFWAIVCNHAHKELLAIGKVIWSACVLVETLAYITSDKSWCRKCLIEPSYSLIVTKLLKTSTVSNTILAHNIIPVSFI